jgi:hypothetical protein
VVQVHELMRSREKEAGPSRITYKKGPVIGNHMAEPR